MRQLRFAANWKMHLGPGETRDYFTTFLAAYAPRADRDVWVFPPAASIEAAAAAAASRPDITVGAQDIYWEAKGAFTGAMSAGIAKAAGARATLVGHSERRHVFGETDAETGKKVRAALAADLQPVLCVGETLPERDGGHTIAVVTRQLEAALGALPGLVVSGITVAYEPVWAIGTGRNATPAQAAEVHTAIRRWLGDHHASRTCILYGGSVNLQNIADLLAEPELDGVLVGGASLDAQGWARLVLTGAA